MMKAPKKKKKKKKKKTSNPAPTIPTDLSMSYAPGYDDSMMRTPGGAMTTKRKKKKTLPNYDWRIIFVKIYFLRKLLWF